MGRSNHRCKVHRANGSEDKPFRRAATNPVASRTGFPTSCTLDRLCMRSSSREAWSKCGEAKHLAAMHPMSDGAHLGALLLAALAAPVPGRNVPGVLSRVGPEPRWARLERGGHGLSLDWREAYRSHVLCRKRTSWRRHRLLVSLTPHHHSIIHLAGAYVRTDSPAQKLIGDLG